MKKVKLLILAALAVMMSATSFAADADFPARPDTAIFVNDFAGVLRLSLIHISYKKRMRPESPHSLAMV